MNGDTPLVSPIGFSLNFDSLNEAFGYPVNFDDPSFSVGFERFQNYCDKYKFNMSIYIIGKDLLNKNYFNIVGEWAKMGHEIGNHTWSHPVNLGSMKNSEIESEISRCEEIIESSTGKKPRGFIAPAWSTSQRLKNVLIKRNYLYDTSDFPSWLMFPIVGKMALNHFNKRSLFRILNRRDQWINVFGVRTPYLFEGNLIEFPIPTTNKRVACWHTLSFLLGWDRYERLFRKCLKENSPFYYLVHPADLLDSSDLSFSHRHSLERLDVPLAIKKEYFNRALEILIETGRPIVTMEQLTKTWKSGLKLNTTPKQL